MIASSLNNKNSSTLASSRQNNNKIYCHRVDSTTMKQPLILLLISFVLGLAIGSLYTNNDAMSIADRLATTTTTTTDYQASLLVEVTSDHNDDDDNNIVVDDDDDDLDVPTNDYNPKQNGWCPKNAECFNTDLCHPCQQRFLIIFTLPRSASTTLTWMLDKLPGLHMGGENNDQLTKLHDMYDSVLGMNEFVRGTNRSGYTAWGHNPIPYQTFSCISQSIIQMLNPPLLDLGGEHILNPEEARNNIIGFKTIRYLSEVGKTEQIQSKVDFVKNHFPCSRVVININSDIVQRANSQMKHFGNKNVTNTTLIKRFRGQNRKYQMMYEMFNNNNNNNNGTTKQQQQQQQQQHAFLLDKSEWKQNITKLNDLVTWLGYDSICHFKELLELNTLGGYENNRTEFSYDTSKCNKYPY